MLNVVEEVAEERAHIKWSQVHSQHKGKTLVIYVFQDAMKFHGVPALRWNFQPVPTNDPWYTDEFFNGVRLPASALQLQRIADLTGCMLLTPKIIDLIWLQATVRFNPVINTPSFPDAPPLHRNIVANSHIHVVHQEIEKKLFKANGAPGGLTSCVGKYWCLTNRLTEPDGLLYKADTACNYGWTSTKGQFAGVTPGVRCWQQPGFRHDHHHWDPSQTIRLMYRKAVFGNEVDHLEVVDLHDVAKDPALAPMLHHDPGALEYLRQAGEPPPSGDVAIPMYAPEIDLDSISIHPPGQPPPNLR